MFSLGCDYFTLSDETSEISAFKKRLTGQYETVPGMERLCGANKDGLETLFSVDDAASILLLL